MKTTIFILSIVFSMLTLTSVANPNGYYHRHHRSPVIVYSQPVPSVYYQPVQPPVCQYTQRPKVVVYRPAPYYQNEHRGSGYYRNEYREHHGKGNSGHHR